MAVQTTPNLGLTLPYQSDPVAVSTQNSNMTLIDTAFGALPSGKTVQGEINELDSTTVKVGSGIDHAEVFGSSASNILILRSYLDSGATNYLQLVLLGNGQKAQLVRATNGAESAMFDLALKSDLAGITSNSEVKSQITAATGITINSVLKQEIGKLVVVYMYITTTAAINAGVDIFSGLPSPTGTQNFTVTFLAHTASSETDTFRMSLVDGGKVRTLDALQNGKVYRATFMYFKM